MHALLLIAALIASSGSAGKPGLAGRGNVATGLRPLTCTAATACDLWYVADDWAGSGNWASRDGTVATVTGTPTREFSTAFNRWTVGGFSSSNYFTTSSLARPTSSSKITWEFVLSSAGAINSGAQYSMLMSQASGSGTGIYYAFNRTGTVMDIYYGNNGADRDQPSISLSTYDSKPILVTVVTDYVAATVSTYINGALLQTKSSITPTLDAGNVAIKLGIYQDNSTGPQKGSYIEVLRHLSAFDGGTVGTRAAPFNGLKGH